VNTQGRELREYLLVCRNVSTTSTTAQFHLLIPDGGIDPDYDTFKFLYTSIDATNPGGSGLTTWNITAANPTHVEIASTTTFNPNGQSFFFYIMLF
jgi:hypothetical protein